MCFLMTQIRMIPYIRVIRQGEIVIKVKKSDASNKSDASTKSDASNKSDGGRDRM